MAKMMAVLVMAMMQFTAAPTYVPVPMVVPAVLEEYGLPGVEFCDMGQCTWLEGMETSGKADLSHPHNRRTRSSCLARWKNAYGVP